jgi:hypothetical protein
MIEQTSYDLPGVGITWEVPGYWCYAAVEQVIRLFMLSQAVSQEEVAHDFFIAYAQAGQTGAGDVGTIAAYAKAVCRATTDPEIVQDMTEEEFDNYYDVVKSTFTATYAEALPSLQADTENRARLGNAYGDLRLDTDLRCKAAGPPDWQPVVETINAGGVAVIGSRLHYQVIYGYRYDETTPNDPDRYWYQVWDPGNGNGRYVVYHGVDAEATIYVTR